MSKEVLSLSDQNVLFSGKTLAAGDSYRQVASITAAA